MAYTTKRTFLSCAGEEEEFFFFFFFRVIASHVMTCETNIGGTLNIHVLSTV